MSGYVRIHRTLIGHAAFRNDAEAMAFAWMVMRAAWKPARVRYKGKAIDLKRGQLAISVRDFADAHERNKNWVSRILQRMRDEDMIETDAGTGVLTITIRNYDEYQAESEKLGTGVGTQLGTHAGQTRDTEQGREEGKKVEEVEAAPQLRASPQPVSEAVGAWNASAAVAGWPAARVISPSRRASTNARLREHGLDGWKAAVIRAQASPYLGGSPPPPWFTYDWIVKSSNFLKLIEGNYDRNRASDQQKPSAWGVARDVNRVRPDDTGQRLLEQHPSAGGTEAGRLG